MRPLGLHAEWDVNSTHNTAARPARDERRDKRTSTWPLLSLPLVALGTRWRPSSDHTSNRQRIPSRT